MNGWDDRSGLVAGEEVRRRAPSRLLLVVDVCERLPVGVADDVAAVGLLGGQSGGKRRTVIECALSLPAAG